MIAHLESSEYISDLFPLDHPPVRWQMTLRQEVGEYAAIVLSFRLWYMSIHVGRHDHEMCEDAGRHRSGPCGLNEWMGDSAEIVVHGDLDQVSGEDGTAAQ